MLKENNLSKTVSRLQDTRHKLRSDEHDLEDWLLWLLKDVSVVVDEFAGLVHSLPSSHLLAHLLGLPHGFTSWPSVLVVALGVDFLPGSAAGVDGVSGTLVDGRGSMAHLLHAVAHLVQEFGEVQLLELGLLGEVDEYYGLSDDGGLVWLHI